jgi:hypothetical protein
MFPFLANMSEQKKQKYLIFVFFAVLLITFLVLLNFFKKPKMPSSLMISIPQFRQVNIDFQTLENPLFKTLRPFELIPPFSAAPGRENPFLPF